MDKEYCKVEYYKGLVQKLIIASRLHDLREIHKFTIAQLANIIELGTTESDVYSWEAGWDKLDHFIKSRELIDKYFENPNNMPINEYPSVDQLFKLCKIYNLPPNYLLANETNSWQLYKSKNQINQYDQINYDWPHYELHYHDLFIKMTVKFMNMVENDQKSFAADDRNYLFIINKGY